MCAKRRPGGTHRLLYLVEGKGCSGVFSVLLLRCEGVGGSLEGISLTAFRFSKVVIFQDSRFCDFSDFWNFDFFEDWTSGSGISVGGTLKMGSHEGLRGVFPGQRTWGSLLAVAWPHRFSASWQSLLGLRSGRVRVSPSLMASRRFSLHQSQDWRKRRSAGMAGLLTLCIFITPGWCKDVQG